MYHAVLGGMLWCSWFRYCAMSHKVVGLIPDDVTGIFHWHDPSGRTMAPGSTQPPTETNTRYISQGQSRPVRGLTTLPPSCVVCLEIWETQPHGTLRACPGFNAFHSIVLDKICLRNTIKHNYFNWNLVMGSLYTHSLRQHVSVITRPSSGLQRAEYATCRRIPLVRNWIPLCSHCCIKHCKIVKIVMLRLTYTA